MTNLGIAPAGLLNARPLMAFMGQCSQRVLRRELHWTALCMKDCPFTRATPVPCSASNFLPSLPDHHPPILYPPALNVHAEVDRRGTCLSCRAYADGPDLRCFPAAGLCGKPSSVTPTPVSTRPPKRRMQPPDHQDTVPTFALSEDIPPRRGAGQRTTGAHKPPHEIR